MTGAFAGSSLRARLPYLLAALVLAVFLVLPWGLSGYWVRVFSSIFMYAALAQSINFMAGFTGYADFGNVVFFGIGAYTTTLLMTRAEVPFVVAFLAGGCVASLAAAVLGLPLLRLRGHYFAIATLGVLEAVREITTNVAFFGGGMGITLPVFAEAPEPFFRLIYYAMLAAVCAYTGIAWWFTRSRFGYALRTIKSDEEAAGVIGIAATRYKVTVWAISAGCTGLVGGIYAYWLKYIEPPFVFDIMISIKAWIMMLLGGAGTLLGPIAGAFLLELLSVFIWGQFLRGHMLILGAVIMLVVLFMPAGFMDLVRQRFSLVAVL
ncbi:MAG: branched-chain amino acid ABC transporter permease, partial [Dehalococcoidia bacterium]|nr:branched-chain amino acid ABC transporter permease [Dehalococcoidia bacterium]